MRLDAVRGFNYAFAHLHIKIIYHKTSLFFSLSPQNFPDVSCVCMVGVFERFRNALPFSDCVILLCYITWDPF